jgi:hypothetical protein
MDFFDHQERARSNTKRLVFLFCLAVTLTLLTVYLAVSGILNLTYLFVGGPFFSPSRTGWFSQLAIRFGADNEVSDAVISVTFGALKLLNRDEIQGVIAQEFSHILNGDMRLNLRLIGWLHAAYGFRHDDDRPAADVA